jgi:MscS family membrane protein
MLDLQSFAPPGWMYEAFAVIFATLVANFILRRLITRLQARLELTKNPWDDAFIGAIRRPVSVLVWVVGLSIAIDLVGAKSDSGLLEIVDPARHVTVIVCLAWFLIGFIVRAESGLLEAGRLQGRELDRTTLDAIAKLLRVSVLITAALVVLQTLGFSVSGVLAFGGIGGIAIGFAAKDLLANFFGGLMVYLDRPFAVGDWIRSPDRQIEGTVENIGWRLTCIRTFDMRPLYIPNATFTTIAVENPSRMRNRRIYETIGIRYCDVDAIRAIVEDVKRMLREHQAIDQSQTMIVNFNAFAPSSLDFFVYVFTKTTAWVEYHAIKQDVLLEIVAIIERHGAEIAFPTSTIHLESTPGSAADDISIEPSEITRQ